MKFLKGLALALLSFLLFLSLSVFGLALTINYTILNPDFVISEINKLDIASLAGELIGEQIPQEGEFMAEAIDDAIADLEPWIKEQADTVIHSGYDYLLGRSQSLNLVIPLEPLKESLKESTRDAFFQSLPPEAKGLPPAELERYFDEYYQDFTKDIPSTFELNESSLSPEVMAQVEQAKQAVGYFQLGFKALIGFMLFLTLCIILINRQVKSTTRGLGITFLTYGAFEYAGIFAIKHLAASQLAQLELPSSLQTWLPQFLADFLVPLQMFSLGLLIAGVILIIISIAYKSPEPSF